MQTFDFEENLRKALWKLQQSEDELLRNYYKLGFTTGYRLGLKQYLQEMDDSVNDTVSESKVRAFSAAIPKAVLEAERILRECSHD